MEVLAIIAAMAAGAHYLNKEDVQDNVIHSSQTTAEISKFHSQFLKIQLKFQKSTVKS